MTTMTRKQYSQTPRKGWPGPGEEELIEAILRPLGLLRAGEVAVDIGAGDGAYLSNTKFLEEYFGFQRLLFDVDGRGNPNVIEGKITVENVATVFHRHEVPYLPAILSIDVDGYDWHLLRELHAMQFQPAVIVCEFQGTLDPLVPVTVPYEPDGPIWREGDGNHFGASWAAMKELNERNGYVYVTQCACLNSFFVRSDLSTPGLPWNPTPPPVAKYHRSVKGPWERV
jgi:hypothetical protein